LSFIIYGLIGLAVSMVARSFASGYRELERYEDDLKNDPVHQEWKREFSSRAQLKQRPQHPPKSMR
jgi:hypothetical protein